MAHAGAEFDVTGGKGWFLNDGAFHTDTTHRIKFSPACVAGSKSAVSQFLVLACGDNDFGPFCSIGRAQVQRSTSTGTDSSAPVGTTFTLTLARRYLEAKDRRAKVTVATLEQEFAAATDDAAVLSEPWSTGQLLDAALQRTARKRKKAAANDPVTKDHAQTRFKK